MIDDEAGSMTDPASSAPGQSTTESTEAWRHYPFELVPSDPEFDFPAAEGNHESYEADTWFIAGELTAVGGRRFAFLTIFNKNRPGGSVIADFHTLALFDVDRGTYGSYTDYDMQRPDTPPDAVSKMSFGDGHLDLRYDGRAGSSAWQTRRDSAGELVPYAYELALRGVDQAGAVMVLQLTVTSTRPPVPVGASDYGGRIACMGQAETFSYFQTGLTMTGSLTWGTTVEQVSGINGHVDRQWFPLPPGAGDGLALGAPKAISHEWRTIHLDNGVDFVGWRQFDRRAGNATVPFTGATVTGPGMPPLCVEDVAVTNHSYVRWPEAVRQLGRPPAVGRYMPDRHTLTSEILDLRLTGEPLVPAPAHALPVEYMEGPFSFRGTMRGEPVNGFGISERSLALYRDWELVDVVRVTLRGAAAEPELTAAVDVLEDLIRVGRRDDAANHLQSVLRPAISTFDGKRRAALTQILDDLESVSSRE